MECKTIDDFIGVPMMLEALGESVSGTIKFGVKLPGRPGTTPLVECPTNSQKEIEGQKPRYWFVNDEQSIKVRLDSYAIREHEIAGIGYDIETFKYVLIRR
jgi:hypothetical protein